jgi:hypothetical protein
MSWNFGDAHQQANRTDLPTEFYRTLIHQESGNTQCKCYCASRCICADVTESSTTRQAFSTLSASESGGRYCGLIEVATICMAKC